MISYKDLNLSGITYLDQVDGFPGLYWGTDFTAGDLYEAEELYRAGHKIKSNRLVFVTYPEGKVYEPLMAIDGQYFGKPVGSNGCVYILEVDFKAQNVMIHSWTLKARSLRSEAVIPLSEVKDCYNLMLDIEPLTLIRQGHEDVFDVVWPEKGSFPIDPSESFDYRENGYLVFSKWYEDPDYREEVVIRKYPSGEILETFPGTMMTMPDGQKWLLKGKK